MSDAPHRDPADERAVLAKLLSTNAEFVSEVLTPAQGRPAPSVMAALRAARSLDGVVDDVLRSLVRQARDEGRTWAEIGDIFGTSRQAAFQRFGGGAGGFQVPPMPPMPPTPPMPPVPDLPPMPEMPDWPKMPDLGQVPGFGSIPGQPFGAPDNPGDPGNPPPGRGHQAPGPGHPHPGSWHPGHGPGAPGHSGPLGHPREDESGE
ncbi:hypothetical protein [Nocardia yunnanensis]|uniref:hypothetical protein n=1 Tax=Nocardia yunnanensis TaxID=2382165 RepID=UPI0016569C04|nr:hypothetical protein [Nocardia yunnanensis]